MAKDAVVSWGPSFLLGWGFTCQIEVNEMEKWRMVKKVLRRDGWGVAVVAADMDG